LSNINSPSGFRSSRGSGFYPPALHLARVHPPRLENNTGSPFLAIPWDAQTGSKVKVGPRVA
jgi:hypothetical protein